MIIQEFQAWGEKDPVAQFQWCIAKDAELRKRWRCACGKKLPIKGIWLHRWDGFRFDNRLENITPKTKAGYYCDSCANRRELGLD